MGRDVHGIYEGYNVKFKLTIAARHYTHCIR